MTRLGVAAGSSRSGGGLLLASELPLPEWRRCVVTLLTSSLTLSVLLGGQLAHLSHIRYPLHVTLSLLACCPADQIPVLDTPPNNDAHPRRFAQLRFQPAPSAHGQTTTLLHVLSQSQPTAPLSEHTAANTHLRGKLGWCVRWCQTPSAVVRFMNLVSSLSAWPTASTYVRRTQSGHMALVFLVWASR